MKWLFAGIVVIALGSLFFKDSLLPEATPPDVVAENEVIREDEVEPISGEEEPLPMRTVIAEGLTIPWDIVFLDDNELLIAERTGVVRYRGVNETTQIEVPNVLHQGEGGLLGMIADPDFDTNKYVYFYITSSQEDGVNASVNKVVRYTFTGSAFSEATTIIDNIPGSLYHNGGRITFGPDGYLYITTGDARMPASAQNTASLAGKILRIGKNGEIPADNPFGNAVYSYGHRNPQGLAWDAAGNLWSTEHGRTSATETGMDELNLIVKGGNYGWPESEGDLVLPGTIAPNIHSGAGATWAPAGATYYNGSIFFGGLKGAALYEVVLDGENVLELKTHLKNEYGRIRTTLIGSDGGLYLMTSNRDARGSVNPGDDRIVRLNPEQFDN